MAISRRIDYSFGGVVCIQFHLREGTRAVPINVIQNGQNGQVAEQK